MTIHGYELITDWKNSTSGKIARAKKGGRIYFLKKYQTPVNPVMNGALDAKTFAVNKEKFERFVAYRRRVNTTIRPISGEGGNIVIPIDEFVEDNHYVEASPIVEGVVSDEELEAALSTMPLDNKLMLMLTAAGALSSVHSKGIVHSDLKLTNVLVAQKGDRYVAKLIDFDSSYFLDDKPIDDIIGDINYYSPELGIFSSAEDERAELASTLTEKSDIFSLGLIFHKYLTNRLPEAKSLSERLQKRKDRGKAIYCWSVLVNDCELKLSDEITNLKYRALISDMLERDPAKRPTAVQVLRRLKEPDIPLALEEPWPEHRLLVDKAKLRAAYAAFRKISVGGVKKYEVYGTEGKRSEITVEELISSGIATLAEPERFSDPWPEHAIVFDEERLRSRGLVSSKQKVLAGVKGYEFRYADSSVRFLTLQTLIAMRFVRKTEDGKAPPVEESHDAPRVEVEESFCDPWAEHDVTFDIDVMRARGYVRSEQTTFNGVNGYYLFDRKGTRRFIRVEMLIMFKMAKRNA